MALTRVRFLADSRNGDWKKGDLGEVEKTLVTPPQNQNTIYVVQIGDKKVWATEKDVEPNEQLTIFDVLATVASSSGTT